MKKYVGPAVLEIPDEEVRWLVDDVGREEDEEEGAEEEEKEGHATAPGEAGGGKAEEADEGADTWHRVYGNGELPYGGLR